jgi:hypothetical protein
MTDESKANRDLKKEQNKIIAFLKENILLVMFFVINIIVTI